MAETPLHAAEDVPTGFAREIDLLTLRLWPVLAVLVVLIFAYTLKDFYYEDAWASSLVAIIARYFTEHGIFATGGIPIQNYDPLTSEPDTYLHWPPLLYYVLSLVSSAFPGSIRAMHFFMAAVTIGGAAALWRMASRFLDRNSAAFCATTFLVMPITLGDGLFLLHQNLVLFELLLALLFALHYREGGHRPRGYLILSAAAFFLACFTSWEAYLALPGVLLVYAVDRGPATLRIFACWTLAAIAAAALVVVIYARGDGTFLGDIWSIATYRAGLAAKLVPSSERLHPVEGWRGADTATDLFSLRNIIRNYVLRTVLLLGLGTVGLIVPVVAAFRRGSGFAERQAALIVLVPLLTIWLGWQVIMHQHYSVHKYELLFAAPIAAIGLGLAYSWLENLQMNLSDQVWQRMSVAVLINLALPCTMLLMGVITVLMISAGGVNNQLVRFGQRIKSEVPPGAIVITNEANPIPAYYSERHVIRGMRDAPELAQQLGRIREACAGCSLYLAVTARSESQFNEMLEQAAPIYSDATGVIVRLP